MKCLWAIGAVVLFSTAAGFTHSGEKTKDFQVKGTLTKDDPRDQQRGGPSQVHVVPLKKGNRYTIDMVSNDVDSFLRLLDPKGAQLEEDDDSGGGLNARIIFNCSADGDYRIVCTTVGAQGAGAYSLTVKTSGGIPLPTSAHLRITGNRAADFQGDFAINGKAIKLSDLKGKVVLLAFCDVRSSSSAALLPRLGDWQKAYQKEGLAVVGVTFYTSDIGQNLGFDRKTGKVVTTKTADRLSDQELLTAYANHHKIAHAMMALTKQAALDTYDAYAVNSVPQVVLIDREGVIRFIDVGGEKSNKQVESEIKKLIGLK